MTRTLTLLAATALVALSPPAWAGDKALRYSLQEGAVRNEFLRDGPVSAHLLLTPGDKPRLLAAFPAGNSGVGLWLEAGGKPVGWGEVEGLRPVTGKDAQGRVLHGIEAVVTADVPALRVRLAMLGSVRTLRDYQEGGKDTPEVMAVPELGKGSLTWARDRLDGAAGYLLRVEALGGGVAAGAGGALSLEAPPGGTLRLRVTALTGEAPLTPIPVDQLLKPGTGGDPRLRQNLEFLSFREKLAAGSWRFNTYFGRDTLMSLRLLMPVLQPAAVEAGLASVLERLDGRGEVAHEEDIGEFAVLRHRKEGGPPPGRPADTPIHDYKMVDDDFMLAPVVAHYLLETAEGRARAKEFLASRLPSGETYGEALARNFRRVLTLAAPFAQAPGPLTMIALHPGEIVGEWRDSHDGLGGGRVAYNVNAVFVPAALQAIARLEQAGLVKASGTEGAPKQAAAALADAWLREAPRFFEVAMEPAAARDAVASYAKAQGVDAAPALASLPAGPLRFNALSLDAMGQPIRVLNSDDGFALLFLDLPAAQVERSVTALLRPFPAGLLTGAGMVVANAAYADPALQPLFSNQMYHGAVVWSWQQAVLAAGIERQLRRADLPEPTKAALREGQARLWQAIGAGKEVQGSELWSWSFADGRYRPEPFGQRGGDQTESNAAQLWSTVFLAVTPPR